MAEYTEPYALILKSHATNNTLEPYYTQLPEGANTISVTWDGPENLSIFTAPEQSAASRKVIAEIPSGTGRRSTIISHVGVMAGETIFFGATANVPTTGRRAVCTVVNLPLKTSGGVGFSSLLASWWAGGRSESPNRIYGSFYDDSGDGIVEPNYSDGAAPAGRAIEFPANLSRPRDLYGDDGLGRSRADLPESCKDAFKSDFYSAGAYQFWLGAQIADVQACGEPAGYPSAVDLQSAGIHNTGRPRYRNFGDPHRRVAQGGWYTPFRCAGQYATSGDLMSGGVK